MFFKSTPAVSVVDAATAVKRSNVGFIDVRTPAEYKNGHAQGVQNVPFDMLDDAQMDRLRKLEAVYVICQSGGRSSMATSKLISAQINAINVTGGTNAWRAHGLPLQ
jgi:rhodanese-related sulfurtransferase